MGKDEWRSPTMEEDDDIMSLIIIWITKKSQELRLNLTANQIADYAEIIFSNLKIHVSHNATEDES